MESHKVSSPCMQPTYLLVLYMKTMCLLLIEKGESLETSLEIQNWGVLPPTFVTCCGQVLNKRQDSLLLLTLACTPMEWSCLGSASVTKIFHSTDENLLSKEDCCGYQSKRFSIPLTWLWQSHRFPADQISWIFSHCQADITPLSHKDEKSNENAPAMFP